MDGSGNAGDHVARYREDGYAVVRGVFSATEIAELAQAFDRMYAEGMAHRASFRHGNLFFRIGADPRLGKVVKMVQWPAYVDATLARFRTDPRMLAIVEPLIGRNVKQIINQLHWKPPGAVSADFAFHQDVRFRRPREAYRNLFSSYIQTGIAIDRHSAASGAMKMFPGSHRLGELDLAGGRNVQGQGLGEADELRRAGLDPADAVDLLLEPGDVALWNPFTVHGSGPNIGAPDRRFYLNGYVAAADCDRGEWAFRDGQPCTLGQPVLVHYEGLANRPEPHYVEEVPVEDGRSSLKI